MSRFIKYIQETVNNKPLHECRYDVNKKVYIYKRVYDDEGETYKLIRETINDVTNAGGRKPTEAELLLYCQPSNKQKILQDRSYIETSNLNEKEKQLFNILNYLDDYYKLDSIIQGVEYRPQTFESLKAAIKTKEEEAEKELKNKIIHYQAKLHELKENQNIIAQQYNLAQKQFEENEEMKHSIEYEKNKKTSYAYSIENELNKIKNLIKTYIDNKSNNKYGDQDSIIEVTVTNAGNGYDDSTTIECGSAVLIPIIKEGKIESVSVQDPGQNFGREPQYEIKGKGSGCVLELIRGNGKQWFDIQNIRTEVLKLGALNNFFKQQDVTEFKHIMQQMNYILNDKLILETALQTRLEESLKKIDNAEKRKQVQYNVLKLLQILKFRKHDVSQKKQLEKDINNIFIVLDAIIDYKGVVVGQPNDEVQQPIQEEEEDDEEVNFEDLFDGLVE